MRAKDTASTGIVDVINAIDPTIADQARIAAKGLIDQGRHAVDRAGRVRY